MTWMQIKSLRKSALAEQKCTDKSFDGKKKPKLVEGFELSSQSTSKETFL
jgi:hypothetical protein